MIKPEGESLDTTPLLRQRQSELTEIIEAVRAIKSSSHWMLLGEKVFQPTIAKADRRLRNEKETIEMYRLQGQLIGLEITDLLKLERTLLKELESLTKKLNASKNPQDGA